MVQFNQLKFDTNGNLIIDIQVQEQPYYTNVFLDQIKIDTENTYIDGKPSNNAIYSSTISGNQKKYQVQISSSQLLATNKNILFVWVKTKGSPSISTPCGQDNEYTVGVCYHKDIIYNTGIKFIKELESCCEIPKNFIDFILKLDALELSIQTENYDFVIEMWKYLIDTQYSNLIQTKCGCNYG